MVILQETGDTTVIGVAAGLESALCSSPWAGFSLQLVETELFSCKLSGAQSWSSARLAQGRQGVLAPVPSQMASRWSGTAASRQCGAWADKPAAISTQARAEARPHNTAAYAHTPILVAL